MVLENRYIYHATNVSNINSIIEKGLIKNYDGIFFADTIAGAGTFAMMHGVPMEDIRVIEIDTSLLNQNLFTEGTDHNPVVFSQIKVYVYPENIQSSCINNIYMFGEGDD